jgi:hypothetical protein
MSREIKAKPANLRERVAGGRNAEQSCRVGRESLEQVVQRKLAIVNGGKQGWKGVLDLILGRTSLMALEEEQKGKEYRGRRSQ